MTLARKDTCSQPTDRANRELRFRSQETRRFEVGKGDAIALPPRLRTTLFSAQEILHVFNIFRAFLEAFLLTRHGTASSGHGNTESRAHSLAEEGAEAQATPTQDARSRQSRVLETCFKKRHFQLASTRLFMEAACLPNLLFLQ